MKQEMMKLQVPIDRNVKEAWEERIKNNGFDSVQSYIRFIAKADVDGRKVDLGERTRVTPQAAERYDKMVDGIEKSPDTHLSKAYDDVDEMMKDLQA